MLENLTGVPRMVTQPAQHQAFPVKALITLKTEGSVRKTIYKPWTRDPVEKEGGGGSAV